MFVMIGFVYDVYSDVGEIHRELLCYTLVLPSLNRIYTCCGAMDLVSDVGENTEERRKFNSRSPPYEPKN